MKRLLAIPLAIFLFLNSTAQDFTPNYDESKIPDYTLPALLKGKDGKKVTTSKQWQDWRRDEVFSDFEEYVYGKIPDGDVDVEVEKLQEKSVYEGTATLKEVRITFSANSKKISMDVLMYLPNSPEKIPLFVGLNFYGNHTITEDPDVHLASSWVRNNDDFGITDNKATDQSRGKRTNRWPIRKVIERGYGVATIYYGDIDPDYNNFSDGIHELFYKTDQKAPKENEWGSIAAWSWGLSRAMDYFEQDDRIDASKVALMGHSRLGKTSLWAGAADERFAIVISNDSGCGGAALSRRRIGETVGRINSSFPHWFNDNFNEYNENEDALPIDQHMLIALIAPRPVYVASAEDDRWADPKGEFLSAYHAGEVYKLLGLDPLPSENMPAVNQPVHKSVGYHMRSGGHDVKDVDWENWMDFADKHF